MVNGSGYPLWIDPKEEPIFREAGRMIERRLVAYRTKFNGAKLSPENMLAMAAIDLASNLRRRDIDANPAIVSKDLAEMTADLQSFLDDESRQS